MTMHKHIRTDIHTHTHTHTYDHRHRTEGVRQVWGRSLLHRRGCSGSSNWSRRSRLLTGCRCLPPALLLVLGHVQSLVNFLRNWHDFSIQFLLDLEQCHAVLVCDEVDSNAEMAKASRTADPMEVGLGGLREVKVDDNVDGWDVYAASEEV